MIRFNGLMAFFLASFLSAALLRFALRLLNIRHLQRHGSEVPDFLAGEIDAEKTSKAARYGAELLSLAALEDLAQDACLLAVLLGGLPPRLLGLLPSWKDHFLPAGLLFFFLLGLAASLLALPFDIYRTFVIERRYGFSTTTAGLWLSDRLKGLAAAAVLAGVILGAVLLLVEASGLWWLWAWLSLLLFELLLLWLYPVAIAPLFNRYEPVADEALKTDLTALMARAGLETEGIYQVDAGKRSRHTNAYFTGLGKTKRIVLFDTLLASHPGPEIAAIVAHEIGHWQQKHTLRQLPAKAPWTLLFLWLASRLTAWPLLYETFGFPTPVPFAGLLLAWACLVPLGTFAAPLVTALLRLFEKEADDAAVVLLGDSAPLTAALKRLARDNLASLSPHPLYAFFYCSHPPLAERIGRLLPGRSS